MLLAGDLGALDETKPCAICAATLDTFISILGAEAGNLALKVLATAGLYLGGGIPLHILPVLPVSISENQGRFFWPICDWG